MERELEDGWFIAPGGIVNSHFLFHRGKDRDSYHCRKECGEGNLLPGAGSGIMLGNDYHMGVGVRLAKSKGNVFCSKCGKKAPSYAEDVLMLTSNPQIPDHSK